MLLSFITFLLIGNTSCKEFEFNRSLCKDSVKGCETICFVSSLNPNIELQTIKLGQIDFLQSNYCVKNRLSIYGNVVNIDSIYYGSGINRSLPYVAQFVEGKVFENKEMTRLELYFINTAVNFMRSSSHKYVITYNKKRNIISSIQIQFVDR